jgi:hypothetical protein
MKRKAFLAGIINLVLIFGLGLTGCDTGTGGGSSDDGYNAGNGNGNGNDSGDSGGNNSGGTRPNTPTGVNAILSPATGYITVEWNPVSGAASYNVYSSTSSSGPFTKEHINTITSTSYTNMFWPGDIYYFKVTAVNSYGEESTLSSYAFVPIYSLTLRIRNTSGSSIHASIYTGAGNLQEIMVNIDPGTSKTTTSLAQGVNYYVRSSTDILSSTFSSGSSSKTLTFNGSSFN